MGAVSFAAKVEYTTGDQPTIMIARDMDLDGKTDMVIANNLTADVSVIRNTSTAGTIGASSFAAKVDFTVGTQPREVAVGDIDGDDLPDIAAGNFSTNNFSVLRSTSTPGTITASSFAAKVDFAALINPEGLEIVDLDGDGKEDVAVANFSSSMISVFRNTSVSGTPSFATRVDFASGVQPQDISIGDIDGDGKPDIAAGNANFGAGVTVSVLHNTSTSGTIDANSFGPKVDFTTPLNPIQSTIVDVDGDGAPELISANGGAASISVFRNITPAVPAPTISSFTPLSAKVEDSVTITGANFDATASNNTVYFGATKATVTFASTTSLTATVPSGAAFAPISVAKNNRTTTSDDFFLPTYDGVAKTISTGTYADRITFTTNATAWRTAIADLDGDGKPDMVVTNNGPDDISVYHNQSTSGGINGSSFAGQLNYATGTDPVGVAIGDLDGDGKPEIAVANISAVSVSVFHNTSSSGSISFAAKQDFAANGNPLGVAIGDLDGDGKNDLAVTSQASSLISVHRNTSTLGTIDANSFATKVTFAAGTTTFDVAIADIDGDGKKDLISGNSGGDSVSILRNTATAGEITASSFAAKQDFSVGDQPSKVAIGDIDGDGKLDIATGNQTDNTLSVLRNTSTVGTVSFAGQVTFATGTQPISTAIGDLDGDGDADIATSNDPGSMSLFKNNSVSGSISLSPEVNYPFVVAARDIAVADLDSDDRPEIVIPNLNSGIVSVLHNIADPPTVSAISPTSARVGKTVTITGTGFDATTAKNSVYFGAIKANVATATTTSLTAEVPIGATFSPLIVQREKRVGASNKLFMPIFAGGTKTISASTLASKVDFAAGIQPANVAIGDIDGDGKPDVAVPNFGTGSQTVSVYRNTSVTGSISGSSLVSHHQFSSGGNTNSIAIGDLDGDGKMDMVVPNVNPINTIGVFHNTSTSGTIDGTTFAARDDFTSSTNPRDVVLADLDGDGKLDIAAPNASVHTVSVFRNTTIPGDIDANSFTAAQDFFSAGSAPNGVAAGDIDGDGKIDLAISDQTTHTVSVFRNTNTAGTNDASSFAGAVSFAIGNTAMPPTLADLDGDGKLDMAVSSFGTDQVGVFRNTSTSGTINASTFATRVDYTTGDGPQKIAAGDLDGDGKPELVVENQVGSTVSIFKNNSVSGTIDASSFAAKLDVTPGSTPAGVAIGDLDGDGRPDLAVANNGSNSLSIFHNQSDLETVGLSGTTTVSPGSEVQLFRIGLVSYGSYTLNGISVTLSDLSSTTGITSSDLELRMYRSTDETFDSGDTQIGTQSTVNLGSTTTISPSTSENPVDHSFYVVTAFINSSANDGNAFKLGFAQNGVTTSAGGEGAAIAASDGNNITSVVTATKWVFTAQPTGATHLQELTPQPGLAARDDNGNLDVNINGTVTLSVSPSGSLSQSTFTAANGLVPTGNVTISGAGSRTLIATGLGLTPDTTAAFEVAKAAATVTLNNLLAVSDGNPKIGGATTDPPGLEVIFTHNEFGVPLDSPPVEPGAYGVTGTVNDPNYQGSATGTLHILLDDPPKAGFAASATQGNSPFTATFTDRSSGQVDTWFLEPGADNGRVYESRNDSVTVTYSTPGTYTVFLTVRGGGFTDQTSLDIIVNGPPNLENIADASANEDETLVLDLSGIDAETGTWTLSGTDQTLISASSIEGDQITFTPVPHANGSDVVTITRTNVHSLSTSQDVTLTWVPVDDAPTIVDLASTYSAAEDNAIHVGAVANVTDLDSDVGTLVWSASGFDGVLVGSTTASNNGVDLTPAVNAFGDTKATIIVTDPATGATATQDVTLIWTRVNDRPSTPVVGFPADGMTDAPLAPLFSWSARDVDFDALVFDLFLGPTGSSLVQVASRQDATSYSSSELSPGTSYTWVVLAHDPSGATAEASFAFTTEADLRAPLISNVGAAPTERSVTFSWSTDEPATSVLQLTAEDGGAATVNPNPGQLDPSTVEISASDLVREHQLTAEDLRAGIWFGYEIRSTDALGNESEAYSGRVLTLAAPDRTAPLFLVDPYIEGITPESAVVRWSTDEPADSRVRFSRLAAAKATLIAQESAVEVVRDELTEDHIVHLDGLEAGTEYSYEAQSADPAGNLSAVRTGSFVTGIEADVAAPEFTAGPAATAIVDVSALIALEADELVTVQIRFDLDEEISDGRLVAGSQTESEHKIQLAELEPSSRYYFQAIIRDISGNETRSELRTFETRAAPDLVSAEILAGPAIEALTDRSAVLVLTADEPIRVQLLFGSDPNLDDAFLKESGELQMSHVLQLTNLEAETEYFYEVQVRDGANNRTPETRGSFRTASEGEDLPPEIVELFAEGIGLGGATVIWRTSELTTGSLRFAEDVTANAAASGANGLITIREPTRQHRAQLTQLKPDTRYLVTAFALDAQGNGVERSFALRTLRAADDQPPLTETGPNVLGISSVSAVVEVTYNEPVELNLSYATNAELSDATTIPSLQRKRPHRVELAGLEEGSTYWVGLEARDQSGNSSTGPVLSFTTDTEPDQTPPAFVTAPFATDLTSTFARVRLELDEPAAVELTASTTDDLSAPTHSLRNLERRQQHTLELAGLQPGTAYFFQVTADDAGGNQAVSKVTRFESLSRALRPVQITAGPVARRIGDRSATIFLRLDRAAETTVTYYPSQQPELEVSESRGLATEHDVVLTNLMPGTEYAYTVTFGTDGGASGSFRTETTADVKPPRFFGPPVVVDRKHDRVRIEWDTDEVADSEILFSPMVGANAKALASGFNPVVAAKILAETGGERVIVPADVKNHVVTLTNLSPGTRFLFESFCTDPAGNRVEWPVLDFLTSAGPDIAPPVMIGRPIVRGLTQSSFLVAFSTNEPTSATLRSADGAIHLATGSQETNHELRVVGLEPQTTYELTVCATDASGNGPTCDQLSVTTRAAGDRRAPRINTGPIVVAAGAEEVVVELTTDEPTDVAVTYQPAGDAAAARTVEEPEFLTFHRVVLSGLEPGNAYEYAATVTDVAGNESASAAADFTTAAESDVTAPNITSGPSFQGITETGVTIVWTTDEPASSLVDWSIDPAAAKVAAKKLAAAGEPAAKVTATAQTIETLGRVERGELVQQHRMTLADLLPGTTYHIVVTSKDLLSNSVTTDPNGTELFSRHHQFNTRGSSDREAPTFAVNPTVTWTNSTAVVAWGTNERAASRVDWRGGGERDFVEDNALVQDHSLTVTGLKSRTAYRFLITAQDQAGNKLTWGSLDGPMKPVEGSAKILQPPGGGGFFVTENVADSQLPLIIDGPRVREKTASSLTIGWDTDELADSFVRYGPTDELDNVVGSAQDVTQHSVTVTNLEAGQPYFYQISSTDPSGNGATESSVAVVSTAPEVDLVPPRFVEEPTVAASTDDEIVLSWRTDEAAAARIEFASPEGEMFTRQVDRRQATQQVTLDHLEIDTEYELSIYVNDASQNETPEPFLLRVATDAGPDLEPPRILTGPEVKAITDRSASIVWTTDELADSYVDYHGTPYLGSVVGSPRYSFEHAVMLTNLEPDSTYYFRVGSTDRANNGPTVTAVADFITLEAPDIEPPAAPTELQVTSGFSSILLGWTANEEDDLGGYSVYRETEPESFELVATQLEEPRFLDENLEEGVLYRYRVSAVDQENPPNESLLSEIAEGTPNEANVPGAPEILGLEQGALASRPILVIQNAVPVAAEDVLTYTVQVSTQSSFRDIVARGGNIAEGFGGMTRWRVGKSLIPTARYWWRARASHGPFDGPWSRPVRLRPNQAVVPLTSEDFDGDGAVSFSDFFILANGFGSGDPILDLDRDGTVGRGDLNQLKQKFGSQVASKLLFSQGAEVAAGTAVDVDAEATGGQVRVRMRLAGIPRLSGYGLTVLANPPILRYVGRVDSAVVLGKPNRRLSLVLEADDLLHISDHLKGRVSGVELDESLEIELLFALDGQPQNVELVVQEAFLGRGAGRAWRVETVGRAKVVPRSFALYPNYPNPFNPSTIIPVGIPSAVAGGQELRLYNLLGQVIRRWDLVGWNPGFHRVTWDGKDGEGSAVASGVYLVQLDAGDRVSTQKLMLLR